MDILSKLSERLKEVMFDRGLNAPALSKLIDIKSNTITRYLKGTSYPNFEKFILLIDFFHCSADFLLGLSDDPRYQANYLPVPLFCENFRSVLQENNLSQYAVQKATKISWANFHFWLSGKRKPYPDNLIKLATAIDISVDCLLGRIK